jgi:glycosyltransferase involved in cell wall biosynthesis
MAMRVGLLTHSAQAGDAIGNQVAEKLAFFADSGADVQVFIQSSKRLHPRVAPYARCLAEPVTSGREWAFLSFADLLIVEFGHWYSLLHLLPLLVPCRPRIIFDYHGVTPTDLWGEHNRQAIEEGLSRRGLVWCADAAVAHSRFTSDELQHGTGFPGKLIHVLGHPVDTAHYCPGESLKSLRNRLGLAESFILLFVGRLARNKRVGILVEALARLGHTSVPVHLVVVGDATDIYSMEAQRCRERASALNVTDRVHFLGHLADDELLDAYRSADLFLMPSRHEGFCIPLVEAMACGLPVIFARSAALPETAAGTGLAFAPDDADDLARQIRRALAPETAGALLAHMRAEGLKQAAAHDRLLWRRRFGHLIDGVVHASRRVCRQQVDVESRTAACAAFMGAKTLLAPVTVINRGTHVIMHEGPAAFELRCSVRASGIEHAVRAGEGKTPLHGMLLPGQDCSLTIPVPMPRTPGSYLVEIWAEACARGKPRTDTRETLEIGSKSQEQRDLEWGNGPETRPSSGLKANMQLTLTAGKETRSPLASARAALAQADRRQRLPHEYADITEGFLANWKRWIKRKLLGNFKQAYVDVLSRQQSDFNRNILEAVHALAECCDHPVQVNPSGDSAAAMEERAFPVASIERAVKEGKADELWALLQELIWRLDETRQRLTALEERLRATEDSATAAAPE